MVMQVLHVHPKKLKRQSADDLWPSVGIRIQTSRPRSLDYSPGNGSSISDQRGFKPEKHRLKVVPHSKLNCKNIPKRHSKIIPNSKLDSFNKFSLWENTEPLQPLNPNPNHPEPPPTTDHPVFKHQASTGTKTFLGMLRPILQKVGETFSTSFLR